MNAEPSTSYEDYDLFHDFDPVRDVPYCRVYLWMHYLGSGCRVELADLHQNHRPDLMTVVILCDYLMEGTVHQMQSTVVEAVANAVSPD